MERLRRDRHRARRRAPHGDHHHRPAGPDAKRATAVVARAADGSTVEHAADEVIDHALLAPVKAMDPPAARRGRRCSRSASAWDFLSPSLGRPGRVRLPDNWIYIHAPEVQVGPHPELRPVVAVPGRDGRTCPGPSSTSCSKARACGPSRRRASSPSAPRARALGLVDLSRVDRLRVVRMPGVPGLRRGLQGVNVAAPRWPRGHRPLQRIPSGATACKSTTTRDHRHGPCITAMWSVNVEEEYHEEGLGDTAPAPGHRWLAPAKMPCRPQSAPASELSPHHYSAERQGCGR